VMSKPTVEARGLRKAFGEVQALDGLSLAVTAGSVLGLLGPNGSGKTTTVSILATSLRPDGGRATVAGLDVVTEAAQVRRVIGLAGQFAAVDPNLTGRENLRLIGRLSRLGRRQARVRADELLDSFGLNAAADRLVRGYSGGMRRRLDVAAALLHRPAVLFLDEPTAGLDPQSRLALWDTLRELNAAGQTIMSTTHYMEEADQLCGRVAIMDRGRILALDTPAALKQQIDADTIVTVTASGDQDQLAQALTAAVPGVTNTRPIDGGVELHVKGKDRLLPAVVAAAEEAGFPVLDLSVTEPTLETVFINLTGKELRD
jgi:ABC-2 type transport system ATP-binding protein